MQKNGKTITLKCKIELKNMIKKKYKIFSILMLTVSAYFFCPSATAISPEIVLKNMQLLTPEIKEPKRYIIPQNFSRSNNLRRKAGSPFLAKGQLLFVEGFVFDVIGVPVENAVVKIWQANHFGYYNHLVVNKEDFSKYDIDFEGTGTCITDSNGYYSFFTIIPGYYGNNTPHINFIVEHEELGRLETMMFFPMHIKNIEDEKYKSMNIKTRYLTTCKLKNFSSSDLEYGKKCSFDIRLDGFHRRKRY